MKSLFDQTKAHQPLAEQLRPQTIVEVVGQEDVPPLMWQGLLARKPDKKWVAAVLGHNIG